MRSAQGFMLILFFCFAVPAISAEIAAGAFAGAHIPIVQDDAGTGFQYGIKIKFGGIGPLVLEPAIAFISEGDMVHTEDDLEFTQAGGSLQSFTLNVSPGAYHPGTGAAIYLTGGLGVYSLKPEQDYREDSSEFGFNFGLGSVTKVARSVDLDISGRLVVIVLDDGGSRKSAGILAGLNYYFAE